MVRTYTTPADQETTDAFADVTLTDPGNPDGTITIIRAGEAHAFGGTVKNTDDANAIDWQLVGGVNGDDWFVVDSGAAVAAGAVDGWQVVPHFPFYKIQVKANAGGSQGDAKVGAAVKG